VKSLTHEHTKQLKLHNHDNSHGPLVQMVVLDCLQRGLDHYISHKDEILEEHKKSREDGRISLINMQAWVECCEATQRRINEKYS